MKILIACPTADVKDYCLNEYLDAYEAFVTDEELDLFMVDTTPGSTHYMNKLREMGVDCVHMQPPYYPMLNCLVYTVSKAWEVIIKEAWEREVDYILSLEVDVIAPPEAVDILLKVAEENGAQIVAHSYPYVGWRNGAHSLGCMLIDRFLFEPGEPLHDPKHKMVVEVGANANFEDKVWGKPTATGGRVVRLDNFMKLKHLQINVEEHHRGD